MEQRPHAGHPQLIRRWTNVGWLLFIPSVGLLATDLFAPWGKWVGVAGLLAVVAVFGLAAARANRCQCPGCGRGLRRRSVKEEFRCEPCGVAWTTPNYRGEDRGA